MSQHSSPTTVAFPSPEARWMVTFSLRITRSPIRTQDSSPLKPASWGSRPRITFSEKRHSSPTSTKSQIRTKASSTVRAPIRTRPSITQ